MAIPANVDAPHLAGFPMPGSQVISTMGNWSGSPTAYRFDWQADGASIGAPDADVIRLTSSQLGKTITCVVTALNADGEASQASNGLGPVTQRPPGQPDGTNIVDEQRARALMVEQMGFPAYMDAIDERK